jgi:hypothetical protein
LNFFTGVTPGRLFQIATSRSAGHFAIRLASSFWLAKVSKGVVVVAAASSGVAKCGDAVVGIDGERFHLSSFFLAACRRDDHIHHSGRGHKQGNSAGNRRGDGKAMATFGFPARRPSSGIVR